MFVINFNPVITKLLFSVCIYDLPYVLGISFACNYVSVNHQSIYSSRTSCLGGNETARNLVAPPSIKVITSLVQMACII